MEKTCLCSHPSPVLRLKGGVWNAWVGTIIINVQQMIDNPIIYLLLYWCTLIIPLNITSRKYGQLQHTATFLCNKLHRSHVAWKRLFSFWSTCMRGRIGNNTCYVSRTLSCSCIFHTHTHTHTQSSMWESRVVYLRAYSCVYESIAVYGREYSSVF